MISLHPSLMFFSSPSTPIPSKYTHTSCTHMHTHPGYEGSFFVLELITQSIKLKRWNVFKFQGEVQVELRTTKIFWRRQPECMIIFVMNHVFVSLFLSSCRPVSWVSTRPLWTTTRLPWRLLRSVRRPTPSSRRSLRSVQSTVHLLSVRAVQWSQCCLSYCPIYIFLSSYSIWYRLKSVSEETPIYWYTKVYLSYHISLAHHHTTNIEYFLWSSMMALSGTNLHLIWPRLIIMTLLTLIKVQ